MRKLFKFTGCFVVIMSFVFSISFAQKVETIDGVRVVHNGKSGTRGKNPKVTLELVRTIGVVEAEDENIAFYMPSDIALDSQGNMYILDSGNHRIQKFTSDGQYITTIGNKGQGPAEFVYPLSLDVDSKGYLHISDPGNQRVQVLKPDGKDHKTVSFVKDPAGVLRISDSGVMIMGRGGSPFSFSMASFQAKKELPKIIRVLSPDGDLERDFGDQQDFKDFLVNRVGNRFHFAIDKDKNTYVAFDYQNRIEKYSPEGKILWRADRELNYSTEPPKTKSDFKREGGMIRMREPQMNRCSSGIAVDNKGRIWIVNLKRQIKDEEKIEVGVTVTQDAGGARSMGMTVGGNTEVRETDMYQLEVYAPDGILLGKLPLNQFVDDIRIINNRLFLLDRMRGMQYYEYKIVED
ncbi:MAG: 6-bladed beta-propeller [Candidatus Aminicenantes bacterium]|nr:6-bladed beta-propeller [Candidatus Aminicenantes bacterium]